jgi:hypothetical protein
MKRKRGSERTETRIEVGRAVGVQGEWRGGGGEGGSGEVCEGSSPLSVRHNTTVRTGGPPGTTCRGRRGGAGGGSRARHLAMRHHASSCMADESAVG